MPVARVMRCASTGNETAPPSNNSVVLTLAPSATRNVTSPTRGLARQPGARHVLCSLMPTGMGGRRERIMRLLDTLRCRAHQLGDLAHAIAQRTPAQRKRQNRQQEAYVPAPRPPLVRAHETLAGLLRRSQD